MKTPRNLITLLRSLRTITLPASVKERFRADLSAYADLHALADARANLPIRSSFASFVLPARSLYASALTLLLMVAGGTQASFASENAVPGDILYPIKVTVSEPLSFIFSSSREGKAELAARFASRRVDEAAALSSVGKLDQKTAEELAARFDTHVDVLAKETDILEAKGEISMSLAVRTDLEQKLSSRVAEFATMEVVEGAASDSVRMDEETVERFSAHVVEKSKTLATTRERLETALALDVQVTLGSGVELAAIQIPEHTAGTHLFFAASLLEPVASSTATSSATTTIDTATGESEARTFFMPFMQR